MPSAEIVRDFRLVDLTPSPDNKERVERTRPRNAHFLLLSICDELCLWAESLEWWLVDGAEWR